MAIGNTALVSVASRGIDANFTHAQTPPPFESSDPNVLFACGVAWWGCRRNQVHFFENRSKGSGAVKTRIPLTDLMTEFATSKRCQTYKIL